MRRISRLSLLLVVGIQGIFSAAGGSAEPARTLTVTAPQEKSGRVAIVIGNSNYPSGALANPRNDATAMAASLKKLGFDVELKRDATKADIDAILRRFSAKAEKAGVAALFYAGHGIQVSGSNYLVPIDANPRNERDLKRDMVKMDDVIDDMGDARVKLVFFDACRDNPLLRSFSRGGSRGMAAPVEATGTLISFATKHGNTAADGSGQHSPYTAALLAALEDSGGVEIEQMLRRVQQSVKQATGGQQEPWRYGSLDGDFYFRATDVSAGQSRVQQEAVDRAVWEAVRRANAQAARERAELQQSMEKLLTEALARQNAAIEAERAARQSFNGGGVTALNFPQLVTAAQAQTQPPMQLASIAPAGDGLRPAENLLGSISAPGDEWEYVSSDIFGKRQAVIGRVKAVVPGAGVLEEYLVDGRVSGEWVFDGKPSMIGIPIDATLLFAPYWSGDRIGSSAVLNGSQYTVVGISGKFVSNEKVTVPAGSFDTKKLEFQVGISEPRLGVGNLEIVVWYSANQKRLVRQTVKGRHSFPAHRFNGIRETIELVAFRSGAL